MPMREFLARGASSAWQAGVHPDFESAASHYAEALRRGLIEPGKEVRDAGGALVFFSIGAITSAGRDYLARAPTYESGG